MLSGLHSRAMEGGQDQSRAQCRDDARVPADIRDCCRPGRRDIWVVDGEIKLQPHRTVGGVSISIANGTFPIDMLTVDPSQLPTRIPLLADATLCANGVINVTAYCPQFAGKVLTVQLIQYQ